MGNPPTVNAGFPGGAPPEKTFWGALVRRISNILRPEEDANTLIIGTDAEARVAAQPEGEDGTNQFGTVAEWAYRKMRLEAGRMAAYRDYDMMDNEVPEVSSALDIIAEFATQADTPGSETFHIECKDQAVADRITEICKTLKLDKHITPWTREVAKYGGTFVELVATEKSGGQIVAVKPLDPCTMQRNEDQYGVFQDPAFNQFEEVKGETVAKFKPWQIVHFRYRRMLTRMYGNSFLESARRIWKQLNLMEDGMVMARLYRSFMRYVFQIPVDGIVADDVQSYIDKIKKRFRKRSRYNQQTQRLELYDNPMSADEDFFIPTRKDSSANVKALQGQGNLSNIGDIEYFQNKLFTSMKVPKSLLGIERDVNAKATLTEQDVNFARALRAIQQVMADGLREIIRRVLLLDGVDPDKLPEWSIVFPPISTVDEALQWEIEQLKATVASIYHSQLGLLNDDYIYRHYLELTPEEIEAQKAAQADNPPAQRAKNNLDRAKAMGAAAGAGAGAGGNGNGNNPAKPPKGFVLKAPNNLPPSEAEFSAVRKIRKMMQIPLTEDILPGEIQLVRKLRAAEEEFGDFNIEESIFRELLTEARHVNGDRAL